MLIGHYRGRGLCAVRAQPRIVVVAAAADEVVCALGQVPDDVVDGATRGGEMQSLSRFDGRFEP